MDTKIAGFSIGPPTHLDHIGVLCDLLGAPLFVTEDDSVAAANAFYPTLEIIKTDFATITSPRFLDEYDALIYTSNIWAYETYIYARQFYQKPTRVIYCPHGNSDKGWALDLNYSYPYHDIELYYGDHMFDLLKSIRATQPSDQMTRLGNFRYAYYKQNKARQDALVEEHVFSKLEQKERTILYAPTWYTDECPTSFFDACAKMVDHIPENCNLVIKVHPFLKNTHPGQTVHELEKHQGKRNVLFLEDFPLIYPLLNRCDIYVGDFSSIGYDFLTFDRPLFFFDPFEKEGIKTRSHYLHQCGMTIPSSADVFPFIEKHHDQNQDEFSAKRKELYTYTFGDEVPLGTLNEHLLETIRSNYSRSSMDGGNASSITGSGSGSGSASGSSEN